MKKIEDKIKKKPCKFCNGEEHSGLFYIKYYKEQHTWVLRKKDSFGGNAISYCPWCGRSLYDC